MQDERFTARKNLVGKRLDLAIVAAGFKLSRRRAKGIIDSGSAYINGERVRVASRELAFGDEVRIVFEPVATKKLVTELTPEMILYQDANLVVLNKPAGLATQASKKTDKWQILPLLLKYAQQQAWPEREFFLVHRLDKDTSGVLVVARSKQAQQHFEAQFQERSVEKIYEAIVPGQIEASFEVSCRLSNINPASGKVKLVSKGGRESLGRFELLEYLESHALSLVRCLPVTGRSHQIRVHLLAKNRPILGDKVYGSASAKLVELLADDYPARHLLHARRLKICLPDDSEAAAPVAFEAPYPDDFKAILALFRG